VSGAAFSQIGSDNRVGYVSRVAVREIGLDNGAGWIADQVGDWSECVSLGQYNRHKLPVMNR